MTQSQEALPPTEKSLGAEAAVAEGGQRVRGPEDVDATETRPQDDQADQPMPVHHFGFTRFSLFSPDSGSWRLTRGSGEDAASYASHLFSDERMEPRCEIFCDLAAPLYDAMASGRRYRHFVAYSPLLPERWLDRLRAAAERYPVLKLVESETDRVDLSRLIRSRLRRVAPERDTLVFSFRIDDDDLLASDFLDQVEGYLSPDHHGFAVSFATGYAGLWEDGGYTSVRRFQKPLVSMGQGAIGRWTVADRQLDLINIGHHSRTPYRRPVLLDGRAPVFLQTRHTGQDTALQDDLQDVQGARAHVLAQLDRLPEVDDLNVIYQKFPTLRGRVRDAGEKAVDG